MTPDENVVTYVLGGIGYGDIFSVAASGGVSTLLTAPAGVGEVVHSPYFISPDSSRLLYRGREAGSSNDELFSTTLFSGVITKVSDPNAGAARVHEVAVIPDGSTAVFVANEVVGDRAQLFSSPSGGGQNIPLTPTPIRMFERSVSPDGENVVFTSNFLDPEKEELFSVPISGGPIIKLNSPLFEYGDVKQFEFSPDGQTVVYIATPHSNDTHELFQVPTTGGTALRLDSPTPDDTSIVITDEARMQVSVDGKYVVYEVVNRTNFSTVELHAAVIIPEPTTCTLTLGGLCCLLGRRRQLPARVPCPRRSADVGK